ncbi:MAG TPA: FtsQ-type POTRA domain-containing protein [Vicinamibacterales bacterium]
MPVPAPSDRRFRRVHVTPGRKTRLLGVSWWKAGRVALLLALVLYVGYYATRAVLDADALTITRITVSGNSRLSKGEVVTLLDGIRGANMLTVDLESWRVKLLSSPWVADAAIRRVLPGTVAVAITERQPMGIGRVNDDLYLIDDRGGIIDQFGPNYAELDLPIIDGLAAAPRVSGLLIDETRALLAGRVLASLQARPDLARRVSEIDVNDVRDAVLILKGDTALVRVGTEQFVERLQSYLDLAPALRERIAAIDYVDLRFDERVYVRPASKRGK